MAGGVGDRVGVGTQVAAFVATAWDGSDVCDGFVRTLFRSGCRNDNSKCTCCSMLCQLFRGNFDNDLLLLLLWETTLADWVIRFFLWRYNILHRVCQTAKKILDIKELEIDPFCEHHG